MKMENIPDATYLCRMGTELDHQQSTNACLPYPFQQAIDVHLFATCVLHMGRANLLSHATLEVDVEMRLCADCASHCVEGRQIEQDTHRLETSCQIHKVLDQVWCPN